METTDFASTQETTPQIPRERSAFLTVLCVLTFIAVPTILTLNVEGWIVSQAWSSQVEQTMSAYGSMSGGEGMSKYMEESQKAVTLANLTFIISIIGSLLCFWGAFQMWKQKKMGYYIYAIGEIIPVITCLYTLNAMNVLGSTAPYVIPILAVPALTFIVLYGLNLEEMN